MTEVLNRIITYLTDRPRNTPEILEHVNSTSRKGVTLEGLHEILKESDEIVKVGYMKRSGIISGGYTICEWATQIWIEENHPNWEEGEEIITGYQPQQKSTYKT